MKTKENRLAMILMAAGAALVMSGCTGKAETTAELVHTQDWDAEEISNITVNYTSDKVYVLPADDDKVSLKEYCSADSSDYYAAASMDHGTLKIQNGKRPEKAYSFYAEIYVPDGYIEKLEVTTTSGVITVQSAADSESIDMKLSTDSGSVEMSGICGTVNVETDSGNIAVSDSKCSGSLKTNSGKATVQITGLTGNLEVYSKSGKIEAALPENDSYQLSAKTDSGTVHNDFGEPFVFETEKKYLTGNYGQDPAYSITLETQSSTIDVQRNND